MKDIVKGVGILEETIRLAVRHKDYDRVTELADLYKKLFTGEDICSLLKQVAVREDARMFEQRKRIYESVMPAVANNIGKVYLKPLRSNRVFSSEESKDETALNEVRTAKKEFWFGDSDSGVDAYLRTRWVSLAKLDPNAFIAVEFDYFDFKTQKAKPYPVEYSCFEAINYNYINGKLDWLIIERPIKFRRKSGDSYMLVDGFKYILYLENHTITYTEVDFESPQVEEGVNIDDLIITELQAGANNQNVRRKFIVNTYQPNAGMVPAFRVGVEPDDVTESRTCVSIFHAAVPFFKKELKAGSELDISMALHAFPQKLQYGARCEGDKARGIQCKDGRTLDGGTCPVCNGSMVAPVHTTGQDVLMVPLPTRSDDPIMDLDKMLVYKGPDIELIKFQDEYVDRLTEKARKAIFGGTTQIQKTGLKTATEADYSMDDTYDALQPFAGKYSYGWLYIMGLIVTFLDHAKVKDKVVLYHRFPSDFKLKGLGQLSLERKEAKDSGAPQSILDAIDNDILELMYADDNATKLKIRVKNKFLPFSGKTPEEIAMIFTLNKTTKYYETLYNHFDIVFDLIESEDGNADFYVWDYKKQLTEIEKQVQIIMDKMEVANVSKFPIAIEGQPGAASGGLRNSVGGLTGMIEIVKAVSSGVYDLDAAIALAMDRFGLTEEAARKQLGTPKIITDQAAIDKVVALT